MNRPTHVTYPLGTVLSITTGVLLTERFSEVHALLDYLTGDELYTHQLPRAQTHCALLILEQQPGLAEVDASNVNKDNWRAFLDAQVARFGQFVPLDPVPDWTPQDAIDEAVEMVGTDKVKGIRPDGIDALIEDLTNANTLSFCSAMRFPLDNCQTCKYTD